MRRASVGSRIVEDRPMVEREPLPPPISGADRVVEWFGYWPSLHDAEITAISLNAEGESFIRIAACHYLREVDPDGHFKTTKHCRIALVFNDASDIALESDSGFQQNVILSHDWTQVAERWQFSWASAVGLGGSICARQWRIELEPARR